MRYGTLSAGIVLNRYQSPVPSIANTMKEPNTLKYIMRLRAGSESCAIAFNKNWNIEHHYRCKGRVASAGVGFSCEVLHGGYALAVFVA